MFFLAIKGVWAIDNPSYYYCAVAGQECKKGCEWDTKIQGTSFFACKGDTSGYCDNSMSITDRCYKDQCGSEAVCTVDGDCYCSYITGAKNQCDLDCRSIVYYCDISNYECQLKAPNCPTIGINGYNCNTTAGRCNLAGVTDSSKCFLTLNQCSSKCCKSYWSDWSDTCTKKCGQTKTRTCIGSQTCIDNACVGNGTEQCSSDWIVNLAKVEIDSPIGTIDKPIFVDKPVILKWKDIAGETGYRVEIYDQNNVLVKKIDKIIGTSYLVDNSLLSDEKIYHWHVLGMNTNCDGLISEQIGQYSDYGYFRLKHLVTLKGSLYLGDKIIDKAYTLTFNTGGNISEPTVKAGDPQFTQDKIIRGLDYTVKFTPSVNENDLSLKAILLNGRNTDLLNNIGVFNLDNYDFEASLSDMRMNLYLNKINDPWYQTKNGGVWGRTITNAVPSGEIFSEGMVMAKTINCKDCKFYKDWMFEEVPGPKKLAWGELQEFLSKTQNKSRIFEYEGDYTFENNETNFRFYAISGNVKIKKEVTNIVGAIVAMGNIEVESGDLPLMIRGLLFANGNIKLNRDDEKNSTPGVTVEYHPEYLFNYLPQELFVNYSNWQQGI
jgi:hypothetical protein